MCQKYVAIYTDLVSLMLLMKGVLCSFYCLCPSSIADLLKLRSGEGQERGRERENGR